MSSRRTFLTRSLALAAAPLAGCRFTLEQGLFNECRAPGGHAVLRHPLVAAAWDGLRPERVWDCHAHLFGNGKSGKGIWLNPEWDSVLTPAARARRIFYVNASCGGEDDERLDAGIVRRMTHVADELPAGAKVVLLAFDFTYDEKGARREDLTAFCIPNEYAAGIARSRPDRFEWVASIHPYRPDAIAALESAKREGARAVKWLPPAMGIDPASAQCTPFYEALQRLDIPLLAHVGEEQAVKGAAAHALGNPLLLRHALDRGVRVIAAHCATLGASADLDRSSNPGKAPDVPNIELFARMMAERRYEKLLFGDLSAVTQVNRAEHLPTLLERQEWHPRILNGSDYPLPGVMPLFSLDRLVQAGLLEAQALPVLKELRQTNALVFDFVLKRSLRHRGGRFAASIFETRDFFLRPAA
jgi:mannonate dehydratase